MFYPGLTWRINTKQKVVYLTFDDGPVDGITPWVLQQLKQHKAKATFFCIGENILKHRAIFNNILDEGHVTGNHTFNHLNGWKTKTADYLNNIKKCQQVIESNSNSSNDFRPLFRPPYGLIKWPQINQLLHPKTKSETVYSIIMWDVLSYDFDSTLTPQKIIDNVISNSKSGSIIVFHDSLKAEKNLKASLPSVLGILSQKGFVFESLNDR